MTDEKIGELFHKFMDKVIPQKIVKLAKTFSKDSRYSKSAELENLTYNQGLGFISGIQAAERLAKIEVLEEVSSMIDDFEFRTEPSHANAKMRITIMIDNLKEVNK